MTKGNRLEGVHLRKLALPQDGRLGLTFSWVLKDLKTWNGLEEINNRSSTN
jgi:hypothetical protein